MGSRVKVLWWVWRIAERVVQDCPLWGNELAGVEADAAGGGGGERVLRAADGADGDVCVMIVFLWRVRLPGDRYIP
jgi:hypothetical protein